MHFERRGLIWKEIAGILLNTPKSELGSERGPEEGPDSEEGLKKICENKANSMAN